MDIPKRLVGRVIVLLNEYMCVCVFRLVIQSGFAGE